jgi:uncharacterized protein YrrD
MLRTTKDFQSCTLDAQDGHIGQVTDLYFDDASWVVRYLVVDTQSWLNRHQVLISPMSVRRPNWDDQVLPVAITQEQVRNSPAIDTDMPVSRQHERDYLDYYGYPSYWGGSGLWGEGYYPYAIEADDPTYGLTRFERDRALADFAREKRQRHHHDDPHLRSCKAVNGYHIHAVDGDIGHVEDLLVDEDSWAIRYLIVNTSNWWLGHKVLIAPQWITGVHWDDESVTVDMTREAIKLALPFDSTEELNRRIEADLSRRDGVAPPLSTPPPKMTPSAARARQGART